MFAKLQGVTRGYATPAISIFAGVSLFLRDVKWKPGKSARLILANLQQLKRQKNTGKKVFYLRYYCLDLQKITK